MFGRRFRGLPPLTVACAQLTSGAVLTLPLVVLVDHPWTLRVPGAGAWAALDERLTASAFAGMALVGAGLAGLNGRPLAWLRRRSG